MLKIQKKNYEIIEPIVLTDNEDNILYQFDMKITTEELQQIKRIIFEDAEKKQKQYAKADLEEKAKLEEEIDNKIKEKSDKFENICFKEHKAEFKEKAGQYKYEEMVEEMWSFFINFFVEKQLKPLNTGFMNLKKFMNK